MNSVCVWRKYGVAVEETATRSVSTDELAMKQTVSPPTEQTRSRTLVFFTFIIAMLRANTGMSKSVVR